MSHNLMGSIVLADAIVLIAIAVVSTPQFKVLHLTRTARNAFAVMMISIGAWMAWIASLFFSDKLDSINYTPTLYIVRIGTLLGGSWFLWEAARQLWRLRHKVYDD